MLSQKEISQIELLDLKKVHQIGILSPFSSFTAKTLLDRGVEFTASEYILDDPKREKWEEMGVLYPGGHDADYVTEDIDLIVYPNGPIPGNPECEKAEKLGIPAVTVGQMVGLLSKGFRTIAVAGTHGKTTTTALIIWMIKELAGEPSFLVGDADDAVLKLNKNWNVSRENDLLVVESCEYKKQFLDRTPTPFISAVTNIDLDHTDCYPTQDDYNQAFEEFLVNTQHGIVIDMSGKNESNILNNIKNKVEADILDVSELKSKYLPIKHEILPGNHNQKNMLTAAGVGHMLGFETKEIIKALRSFPGMTRRFELAGRTEKGNPVYKDFAHNPAKVTACIQGAKEVYPDREVILVFQPHSFERSYSFRKEFAEAISEADYVLVPNIFSPKRESDEERDLISEDEFVCYLQKPYKNKIIELTGEFKGTIERIKGLEKDNKSVILLASAGDLHQVTDDLI